MGFVLYSVAMFSYLECKLVYEGGAFGACITRSVVQQGESALALEKSALGNVLCDEAEDTRCVTLKVILAPPTRSSASKQALSFFLESVPLFSEDCEEEF